VTRVVLLRHATAVPHAPTDWQRPLAQRGVVEAQQAGQWLRHEGIFPDAVIVSSALRTMQTFDALGFPEHPEPRDEAYNASGAQLADLVRLVAPRASTVVVVAHNPGISDLARALGHCAPLAPACAVVAQWDGPCAVFGHVPVHIVASFAPTPS
jgi:phosphohistidine phosphatase